jgi:DNA-binding CsgD family transcriptional regulator
MIKGWEILTQNIRGLPVPILRQSSYTLDLHFRHVQGQVVHLLQQTILLNTDDEGKFLYELIKLTDITHWQKTSAMSCIFTTPDPELNCLYIPSEDIKIQGKVFSPAELKVLELLANGEKSKDIAEQLHISPHTVDTHRRNMLRKTKSSNTQNLIRLAYLSGSL